MKQEFCTQGYGSRAQGICPFEFPGGICRECPVSTAAFGNAKQVAGKNSGCGNSANPIPGKIKGAFLFFANSLQKRAQFLIGWLNNRRHDDTPCFDCIKRGGICQPECERRRRGA